MNEETEKSTNAMKKFGKAAVEGLGKAAKWAQDVDKYYRQMQKDYEASKNKQAQKDNEVTDIALENLKQRQEREMRYYIESSKKKYTNQLNSVQAFIRAQEEELELRRKLTSGEKEALKSNHSWMQIKLKVLL